MVTKNKVMLNPLKTTLIVVAMVGMVSLLGCKNDTGRLSISKKTMSIIYPFRLCEPIKIDTVYQVEEPCLECAAELIEMAIGSYNSVTGCEIEHTQYIVIYFNPILKNSKI